MSSGFSSAFEDAVDAWNGGISDRSIKINANAGNSITDLDFSKATDISYDLTFLFQKRYSADALYKPWSTSTTTCCSKHQTTSFIIYVNTYMVPSTEDYDKKLWVITHELGHGFGLDDFQNYANYKDHVMNYAYTWSQYTSPSASEFSAVDAIWDH